MSSSAADHFHDIIMPKEEMSRLSFTQVYTTQGSPLPRQSCKDPFVKSQMFVY